MQDKIIDVKTKFFDGKVKVVVSKYSNKDRTAIVLVDPEDGSPCFTATVNLVEESLEDGYVFLKGYSENEGLPEELVKAGIVELTGRVVNTGYVVVPEAKLLV